MATLKEFRDSILDEIHFNASMNGTPPREEFLTLYANALADAEEFEDFEQLPFEGVGPRNKRILIDGYFYDELEDSLAIVSCPFTDSVDVQSLTATDAETHFRRARAFVEESLSGFIQKNADGQGGINVDFFAVLVGGRSLKLKNAHRKTFFVHTVKGEIGGAHSHNTVKDLGGSVLLVIAQKAEINHGN